MKRRKAIAHAEKRGAHAWRDKYRPTYLAVIEDMQEEIKRLQRDNERLEGPPCGLPCTRLQGAEMRAESLKIDLARAEEMQTAERTALLAKWQEALTENERLTARVVERCEEVAKLKTELAAQDGGCLSCPDRQEAELRASSLESEMARVTRHALETANELRAELVAVAAERDHLRAAACADHERDMEKLRAQCDRMIAERNQAREALAVSEAYANSLRPCKCCNGDTDDVAAALRAEEASA